MPAFPPLEDEDDEPPNTLQGAEDACDRDRESPAERASFLVDSLKRVGLKQAILGHGD